MVVALLLVLKQLRLLLSPAPPVRVCLISHLSSLPIGISKAKHAKHAEQIVVVACRLAKMLRLARFRRLVKRWEEHMNTQIMSM